MATYSQVDSKIIDKLSFPHSACNYVYYSNTNGKQLGTLYGTDEITFEKIKSIFKGDAATQVKKGDKVYVLPGHPLSHTRIKEYLKHIGANTTKTLASATVIAGCEDLCEEVKKHDAQAKPVSLLIEASEIYEVVDNYRGNLDLTFDGLTLYPTVATKLHDDFDAGKGTVVSNRTHSKIGFDQNVDLVKDRYFLTPDAMITIYYILSKGLKVLTEETIAEKANSGLKLADEETYLSIYQMLDSGDKTNKQMGISILIHCDLTGDTLYNMWRLSRKFRNAVDYADNSKGVIYFKRTSGWNDLRHLDPAEFIEHAERKEKLTPRIVRELMPDIYKGVKEDSPIKDDPEEWEENSFFEKIDHGDMSYTIQLKEKWKSILKEEKDEPARI
jgi:hypothetical protein